MSFDRLRFALDQNRRIINELFQAHRRCDPDALRDLIMELHLNDAALNTAFEELNK